GDRHVGIGERLARRPLGQRDRSGEQNRNEAGQHTAGAHRSTPFDRWRAVESSPAVRAPPGGRFAAHAAVCRRETGYLGFVTTLADLIVTGVAGRSPGPVGVLPIFLTTSRLAWSAVLPNAVYWPLRNCAFSRQRKNCDPAELGSFVRAIDSTPG